ncbi:MAG: hypothetical protein IKZ09_00050 [Clostridia bacterium]|nr:hypothetical protein [Clostridia bacterium]
MRRTHAILLLCLMLLVSSCAQPIPPAGSAADTTAPAVTENSAVTTAQTDVKTASAPETQGEYALVDWMIFVRYDGRSYTRDFSEPTVIPVDQLGERLGCVESKPPSPTPMDYVVPDFTSFGYPIGTPFYEIAGVPVEYEIAVYDRDAGEYHLLCTQESLPIDATVHHSAFNDAFADGVEIVTDYETYFGAVRQMYAAVDKAFFEDNILAVIHVTEGSSGTGHHVQSVRRVGNHIEILVSRTVSIAATDDTTYCTITAAISREDWQGMEVTVQYFTQEYSITNWGDVLSVETKITHESALFDTFKDGTVEVITDYDAFPGRDQSIFSVYDVAFFEDYVLAIVYLEEGSGSIRNAITNVRRVQDWIEIHIQRNVPPEGTCDMAYWTLTAAIPREEWDGAEIVPVIHTVQS